MNIKSLTSPLANILPTKSADAKKQMEPSSTSDRDADGRQEGSSDDGSPRKRHLSDSEFQEALLKLKSHSGIQENRLDIEVQHRNGIRILLIKDPDGQVIRRMTEEELHLATQHMGRQTGHILNKAM